MYQFNVAPPEVDLLILDQMSDDDLVHFCQTDVYAQGLCTIPKIKNRIDNYQYYKTFDYADILSNIEQYCPYPIMIHRYDKFEDEQTFVISNDIFILYQDKYKNIICLTQEDLNVNGQTYINIDVIGEQMNKTLNTIINSYENNEYVVWDLDLLSIYHVYVNIGLQKYAKIKTINELNEHYKLKLNYQNNTLKDFYKLFILRIWFTSHVILYKLEDDSIDQLDIDINNDFDFTRYIVRLNEDIDDLYNILYDYINNLD